MKDTDKITLTVGQLKRLIRESVVNESIKQFDAVKIGDRGYNYWGASGEVIKKGTVGEFYKKGLFKHKFIDVDEGYPAVLVALDQGIPGKTEAYVYDENGTVDGFQTYWDWP
jgi:hypothetical protein